MKNPLLRGGYVKQATCMALAVTCLVASSIGGADGPMEKKQPSIADQELFFAPVPKAVCGPGDKPETALAGPSAGGAARGRLPGLQLQPATARAR